MNTVHIAGYFEQERMFVMQAIVETLFDTVYLNVRRSCKLRN